jgi:hypothetical protein
MERVQRLLLLLLIAAVPAVAAPAFFAAAPRLCFTAGSVTYQLSPAATAPDYRVRIDNRAPHPDLRIAVVDRAEAADFALVDDVAPDTSPCRSAGLRKTVRLVPADAPADLTIRLTRAGEGADLTLFVHSARVSQEDAAALFALMRHAEGPARLADYR